MARKLLWIDCTAAAIAGLAVLLLKPWLIGLYALPGDFLTLLARANLGYGSYSFSLALRPVRRLLLIQLLVAANLLWAGLCAVWFVRHMHTASIFGLAHLAGEAVFVASLGLNEWRWRHSLTRRQ